MVAGIGIVQGMKWSHRVRPNTRTQTYAHLAVCLSRISFTKFMASPERGLIVHSKDLGTLAWYRKTVNISRGANRRL